MQDQIAIITGAAGTLGLATAQAFVANGAHVVLLDRRLEAAQEAAASLGSDTAQAMACDLTDAQSVSGAVQAIVAKHGRIDHLVNIAGGFRMGPSLQETPDADWEFMLNLNARSVFYMCRAVLPSMIAAGNGRIANVAARVADNPKAKMAPYNVSKAAVVTLTESLAAEQQSSDININCILPGTIDTPVNRSDMPDADFSRWVPPGDLAAVLLFLCSPAARSVNGACIPVYGKS